MSPAQLLDGAAWWLRGKVDRCAGRIKSWVLKRWNQHDEPRKDNR